MWYYPTQQQLYPKTYFDVIIVKGQTYRMKLVDLIQEQEEFEVELETPSQNFIERHCIRYLMLNNFKNGKYYISFQ